MQRTKALGLLHKTVRTNARMSRQGYPGLLGDHARQGEMVDKVTREPEQYLGQIGRRWQVPYGWT